MDSAGFVPDDHWGELKSRLLDIQDRRLRLMDSHGVERMILSLNAPAVQAIPDSCRANEVARRANDILAREVSKRPDRFSAFAALPMQDPDLASRELERCVAQLGFKGALVNGFTQAGNENTTLYYDLPQYWPFWQLVSSRCAVLSAPAQSLAGPCADLRWAPLAAGPDLGVRTGNSGPRAAAHGLGPVRCLSAAIWGRACLTACGGSTTAMPGSRRHRATRQRRRSPTISMPTSFSPPRGISAPRP